jgi:carbon storage regulator
LPEFFTGAIMLVLTRKPGEGIIIGDNIIIKIIEMKSGGILIGIDAPRDTKIYRQEVYDRIRQENIEAAAGWDMADLDILSDKLADRTLK